MPQLSPLKWFYLYIITLMWMIITFIKLNFLFSIYPPMIKKNITKFNFNLKF
uniref:ATP synthase F0 subunit 8 n=1 Tax=Orancistrocerus aterrimus TaxID=2485977 RepID=A0A3G3FWE1_9HYME|nr:ATP synthase F0 subunit 8 [Orancistrocerus aterrimus]AYQ18922.1 ATP synthase F0 subunit 8 [Orancistrocerus aterrimus]